MNIDFSGFARDLAAYTAVDSLQARKLDLDGLLENGVAIAIFRYFIFSMVKNKLTAISYDINLQRFVEGYVGRLAAQVLANMAVGRNRSIESLARLVLMYEVAILVIGVMIDQDETLRNAEPGISGAAAGPWGQQV